MISEHLPSKLYTYPLNLSNHQSSISISKSPDQQTKVSPNHTCAMVGSNLSERHLSQLGEAQNWIAMASRGQSRQGTDQDQKPIGWWEQETTKAAEFQKGDNQLSVGGLDGLVSCLLGNSWAFLIRC
jgi:hypothetical protein